MSEEHEDAFFTKIEELLAKYKSTELEISLLKKSQSQFTSTHLVELIATYIRDIPVKDVDVTTDSIYWCDKIFSEPARKAYRLIMGKRYIPTPCFFVVPCGRCKKETNREFNSWNDLKHAIRPRSYTPPLCEECQRTKDQSSKEFETRWKKEREQDNLQIEKLRSMPYNEYLQTEHWQAVRKRALRRADYRCQLCNKKTTLHVHHRTYANRGHEYPEDVIVLCKPCHERHHGVLPEPDVDYEPDEVPDEEEST